MAMNYRTEIILGQYIINKSLTISLEKKNIVPKNEHPQKINKFGMSLKLLEGSKFATWRYKISS